MFINDIGRQEGLGIPNTNYYQNVEVEALTPEQQAIEQLQEDVEVLQGIEVLQDTKIERLENLQLRENTWKDHYVIFVGDSYAEGYNPDGNVIGWPYLVCNALGIQSDNRAILYKGGAGFRNKVGADTQHPTGYNFLTILQDHTATLTDTQKQKVTDIIIGGSGNDCGYTSTEIQQYVNEFMQYAHTNYPNAKIQLFATTWVYSKADAPNQRITRKAIKDVYDWAYALSSINNNFAFHGNTYQALLDKRVFASDSLHITQSGESRLANAIVSQLLGSDYVTPGGRTVFSCDGVSIGEAVPCGDFINVHFYDDAFYRTTGATLKNSGMLIGYVDDCPYFIGNQYPEEGAIKASFYSTTSASVQSFHEGWFSIVKGTEHTELWVGLIHESDISDTRGIAFTWGNNVQIPIWEC